MRKVSVKGQSGKAAAGGSHQRGNDGEHGPIATNPRIESLECEIDFSGGLQEDPGLAEYTIDLDTGETSVRRLPGANPKLNRRRHLRQLMVLMERPFFALAKRRAEPIEYSSPDGTIESQIQPGTCGMATIYDADLIVFLVDQLAGAASGNGETVILKPGAFLSAIGSTKGGDQYGRFAASIERLSTTKVRTNARPDGKPGPVRTFAWIDRVVRQGRDWHITVSSWLAEGARSKAVLDICPEYFDLGGFDRFLYLTARKHVGRDSGKVFRIKTSTLWKKSGSGCALARFRHEMKSIAIQNHLPEYWLRWDGEWDGLSIFWRR